MNLGGQNSVKLKSKSKMSGKFCHCSKSRPALLMSLIVSVRKKQMIEMNCG
jgi:hypothetical protein